MKRDDGTPVKPPWLKVRLGQGAGYARMRGLIHQRGLHTVCEEALCPNMGRCWEHGRATIMILGDVCTRGCRFCNVAAGPPARPDEDEPRRTAEAVASMGLREVVVTSVTRDDLPDGGAAIWAATIRAIREAVPGVLVEVLVPDFGGSSSALATVMAAAPAVWGHNLETVPSLYGQVRPEADYQRSLDVLRGGHRQGLVTKSGIMVGLGERHDEVLAVMRDALDAGGDIFYIGQYLQPSWEHAAVVRYVEPAEFDAYRDAGLEMGFGVVVSAPLVRSSFHSEEQSEFLATRLG